MRAPSSGRSTITRRSKRPGRKRAGSSTSGRLVAARTIVRSLRVKPSISDRSWLSVCSRSSFPPPNPAPRERPTASISSMKTMAGEACLACSKRSRTRLAPIPTKSSMNSEPLTEKNGTPASPATALASSVLPVPGGPTRRIPCGTFPPEPAEVGRRLQEVDDLEQVALGALEAGNVVELHLHPHEPDPRGTAGRRASVPSGLPPSRPRPGATSRPMLPR